MLSATLKTRHGSIIPFGSFCPRSRPSSAAQERSAQGREPPFQAVWLPQPQHRLFDYSGCSAVLCGMRHRVSVAVANTGAYLKTHQNLTWTRLRAVPLNETAMT